MDEFFAVALVVLPGRDALRVLYRREENLRCEIELDNGAATDSCFHHLSSLT